jgi:hypothetical protein
MERNVPAKTASKAIKETLSKVFHFINSKKSKTPYKHKKMWGAKLIDKEKMSLFEGKKGRELTIRQA